MKKAIRWCLIAVLAAVLVYCAAQLGAILLDYRAGVENYRAVSDQVVTISAGGGDTAAPEQAQATAPDAQPALPDGPASAFAQTAPQPPIEVDFAALKKTYPEAVAWLYSEGTAINYPVMQALDNDYYLRRLPDGRSNNAGSLFLDCAAAPDFTDALSAVFGHNMKNGSMFASLLKYREKGYFDEHPSLWLLTPQGAHRLDVVYARAADGEMVARLMRAQAEDMADVLAWARERSDIAAGVEVAENDRLVALCTCAYFYDDARYVVLARIAD